MFPWVLWRPCIITDRLSKLHALIPSVVLAFWFEAVYFSVRPLNETLATSFLLCAICFGLLACENLRERYFLLAGLFASLVVMLRLHLGVGVLGLRWFAASTFGQVAALHARHAPAFGCFWCRGLDFLGAPFSSFIGYVRINLVDGKQASSVLNLFGGIASRP